MTITATTETMTSSVNKPEQSEKRLESHSCSCGVTVT